MHSQHSTGHAHRIFTSSHAYACVATLPRTPALMHKHPQHLALRARSHAHASPVNECVQRPSNANKHAYILQIAINARCTRILMHWPHSPSRHSTLRCPCHGHSGRCRAVQHASKTLQHGLTLGTTTHAWLRLTDAHAAHARSRTRVCVASSSLTPQVHALTPCMSASPTPHACCLLSHANLLQHHEHRHHTHSHSCLPRALNAQSDWSGHMPLPTRRAHHDEYNSLTPVHAHPARQNAS